MFFFNIKILRKSELQLLGTDWNISSKLFIASHIKWINRIQVLQPFEIAVEDLSKKQGPPKI